MEWFERYVFGETPRSGNISQPSGFALGIWNGLNDMYLGKRHEVAVYPSPTATPWGYENE
jgi:hypothetical protein